MALGIYMKETKSDWENYKIDIATLKNADALQDLKLDDDYFEVMQNEWIVSKHISRFGEIDDNTPCQTKPAIDRAIEAGYAINLIVQAMKDDTIICYKHKSLGELTGLNAYAVNVTYDDIKDLTIKSTKYHILTLQQALNHIAGRAPITIEIMNENSVSKIENNIAQILDDYCAKYNCPGQIAIISINPYTLEWFYNNAPWYTRILKSSSFKGVKRYGNIKAKRLRKLKYLKMSKADIIAYSAKDIPNKYIKRKKVAAVLAYNVSSTDEYNKVIPYVDNVIFTGFTPEKIWQK